MSPTPTPLHQAVCAEIYMALRRELGSRAKVFFAPLGVRLSDKDVPEPDLRVILQENEHRIGEQVIEGPPDLVVEILSKGTARRDLVDKRELYQRFGVPRDRRSAGAQHRGAGSPGGGL